MIQIKTRAEIELMRQAGLVVADALAALRAAVRPGITTADLDAVAREVIYGAGATPSFLGYHGFPATICTSINSEIVHGIPSPKAMIRDGDVVSIDCGAIVEGYHGDAAITVPVGEVSAGQARAAAGDRGVALARHGSGPPRRPADRHLPRRRGVRALAAAPDGGSWGIVEEYVGHGIGTEMHQDPQVHNYVGPRMGRGPQIVPGLALAVEPMVNLGGRHTRVLDDGWTVVTQDGQVSAHFEHSFTVTEDGPWVLTDHDGGRERIAAIRCVPASA